MKMSREGLGITDSDWSVLITPHLEEFAVPQTKKEEFLLLVNRWKEEIVEAPQVATTGA